MELTGFSSVASWMGSAAADPIQARIRQRELAVLGAFCAEQRTDPDTLVAAATASRDVKNDYMRALKQWVVGYAEGERARHEAENAVRSFFIANGLRVIAKPYSDVYRKSSTR